MISLQQLRNPYFMKWGLWAILIVTIPAFVALYGFAPPAQQAGLPTGALVTVYTDQGKVELDAQALQRAKREAAEYYAGLAAMSMQLPPEQRGQVQRMIFDALSTDEVTDFAIAQVAMRDRLRAQGLRVSDNQVATYLRAQGLTREDLRRILQQNRLTESEYAAMIRSQIADELAQSTVHRTARTSLLELWQEYLLTNEILTAEVVRVPVQVDDEMVIDDATIQEEYNRMVSVRDSRILDQERRIYQYVALPAPPQFPPRASQDQLRSAFEEAIEEGRFREMGGYSVRQIIFGSTTGDPETQAEAALERLNAGEDFAALANELTVDPDNAVARDNVSSPTLMGGLVGTIFPEVDAGRYGAEMMSFLDGAEPGDISEVINTPKGTAIVKLVDKAAGSAYGFEEVRQILADDLNEKLRSEHEASRQARTTESFELLRDASARATTLEGIARSLNTDVRTTSPTVATQTFIQGIGDLGRESQSLRRMRPGIISPVLQARDGSVAILELIEEIPESIRPLADVRSSVERAIRRRVATDEAVLLAEQLKTRVESGDALTTAALAIDLTGGTLEPFTREDVPQELGTVTDIMDELQRAGNNDVLIMKAGSPTMVNEVVVLHVTHVDAPSRQEFLADIENLERAFLFAKRQGFVEDFRRDAIVSLKEQARYHRDFRPGS
ncbi:MAG: peptidyl-prolyl cis-trans isomerase [Candidatus Sumerlaeia bacterium]|nr:peptidyl-prolyl cis-trans isomerase [Candidatus Sumerlaeia bacterium]